MLELRGEAGIATPDRYARDDGQGRTGRRRARLEGVIREEILPRLLQTHARAEVPAKIPGLSFETLARALIEDDEGEAQAAFAELSGACDDDLRVMHEVLAPAACRLGEWWAQDSCDFFEVSRGVARLRTFLASIAALGGEGALAPAMLMLTPPGETHRFGAEMAADLFRREEWRVERADGDLRLLGAQSFDAVAVSCGCDQAGASLAAFIAEIRTRTRGRRTPIILGGAYFLGRPERGQNLGIEFVGSTPDLCRRFSQALLKPRQM